MRLLLAGLANRVVVRFTNTARPARRTAASPNSRAKNAKIDLLLDAGHRSLQARHTYSARLGGLWFGTRAGICAARR